MEDKTTRSSPSTDIANVTQNSLSTATGVEEIQPGKELRLSKSSISSLTEISTYANELLWEDIENANAAMSSELEKIEKQLELVKEQEQELEQLEKANAKSPNPNTKLSFIIAGSLMVMLTLYSSVSGLAALKKRQNSAKGHKGVAASMFLVGFGATIGVFMLLWSIYSPRDLIRTRFVKLCLWFLGGLMIVVPVLLAVECFGSLQSRRSIWICLSVIWLLAGILYYMKTSCGRDFPVSTRNIPPNGSRA